MRELITQVEVHGMNFDKLSAKSKSDSEVNGLARNIRLGELFMRLIDALNTEELTVSKLSNILVEEPRIQSLDELKEVKFWISCTYSSSHFEKRVKTEMWKDKIFVYKVWRIIQSLQVKTNKENRSSNKRTRQ